MFTGIIETLGKVVGLKQEGANLHITIESGVSNQLKTDQSVSHNGVCLTVVNVGNSSHTVTAIRETLEKSSLSNLQQGDEVNLERAMAADGRFDGHIVQGHVDSTATCVDTAEEDGSWRFTFSYEPEAETLLVPKGSVCIDGVSLTIAGLNDKTFSVAIIPYTYQHTLFKNYRRGATVNIEYDIIGKYVNRIMNRWQA